MLFLLHAFEGELHVILAEDAMQDVVEDIAKELQGGLGGHAVMDGALGLRHLTGGKRRCDGGHLGDQAQLQRVHVEHHGHLGHNHFIKLICQFRWLLRVNFGASGQNDDLVFPRGVTREGIQSVLKVTDLVGGQVRVTG